MFFPLLALLLSVVPAQAAGTGGQGTGATQAPSVPTTKATNETASLDMDEMKKNLNEWGEQVRVRVGNLLKLAEDKVGAVIYLILLVLLALILVCALCCSGGSRPRYSQLQSDLNERETIYV